ncbi:MAG: aromatic amino acid transport family protein [Cyanobacteria bacterium J06626_6]
MTAYSKRFATAGQALFLRLLIPFHLPNSTDDNSPPVSQHREQQVIWYSACSFQSRRSLDNITSTVEERSQSSIHIVKPQRKTHSKALFSNLDFDGIAYMHRPGSIKNGAVLIAGTTVGAGVLALPAVTLPAGALPSTILMVGVWLYMFVSGLLVAEANIRVMQQTGRPGLGLLATVEATLGRPGAIAAGLVYIFIHYALLIAYTARGGDILASALANLWAQLNPSIAVLTVPTVPLWWGHVAFTMLFGGILYSGSNRFITVVNGLLVTAVVVAFVSLLGLTLGQVQPTRWLTQHWDAVGLAIPVMVVAFVYHNVIPVITTELEGDGGRVRRAIFLGSLVPLVMFALWNGVILGSVEGAAAGGIGDLLDPIELLRQGRSHPLLGEVVAVFSEFAIATSFIGFVVGLLSVFEDIASLGERTKRRRLLYMLILLPPLALSVIEPNIFFDAIDFAGAYGNSILFGIVPALMVWKLRHQASATSCSDNIHPGSLVPGGRPALFAIIILAVAVIAENALIKTGIL